MYTSTFFTAVALLPFALTAPSRLPMPLSHAVRRFPNETSNSTTPDTAPSAPSCDISNLTQPASALKPPTADMTLVMIALGQGTQNYTCSGNSSAAPTAIGALAQLFDASCALSSDPTTDTTELGSIEETAGKASIGAHFFVDNTTPDFDINGLGNTEAKKSEDANAPNPTKDVKWLRLTSQASQGTTSTVKQVYRLNTVGGVAPATCAGKAAGEVFTVAYEAQYWIYA